MKWGILGAGRIAHRFCKALEHVKGCELYAVACRTQEKADVFQSQHPCQKAYAGFEKLIQDKQVDAIYIATPHQYHYHWIMQCLKEKKAVLVEKPACMNTKEIEDVIQCAKENNTLFMEAMKTRFVPLYQEIKKQIAQGAIGDITSIHASLCNNVPAEAITSSYLGDPASMGALSDVGIYPISWIEDYLKEDYSLEHIYTNIKDNVIYYVKAEMKSGRTTVLIECGMDRNKPRQVIINGTKGNIQIEDLHRPTIASINGTQIQKDYEYDDFYSEIKSFVETYQKGMIENEIMPFQSSLRCAQIMDVVHEGMQWNDQTLKLLDKQEQELQFEHLSNDAIQTIGNQLISSQKNYDRTAAIRILDEESKEILFEYLPKEKTEKNFMYMEGKRNVSLLTKHSSFYAVVKNSLYGDFPEIQNNFPEYCPSGGAFPVYVKQKWKYTIEVSGLHEGEDHLLIVNALYKYKNMEIPSFPFRLL